MVRIRRLILEDKKWPSWLQAYYPKAIFANNIWLTVWIVVLTPFTSLKAVWHSCFWFFWTHLHTYWIGGQEIYPGLLSGKNPGWYLKRSTKLLSFTNTSGILSYSMIHWWKHSTANVDIFYFTAQNIRLPTTYQTASGTTLCPDLA